MLLTVALNGAEGVGARGWASPEKSPALEDSRKTLCPPPPLHLWSESCLRAFGDPAQLLTYSRLKDTRHPVQPSPQSGLGWASSNLGGGPEGLSQQAGPHQLAGVGGLHGV